MQTFTIKVTGDTLTAKDMKEAVWVMTNLSADEIIVTEN